MTTGKFRGVYAFNATPLKDGGDAIDMDGLRGLAEFVVEHGVHGVVVFGSTGSNGSFTSQERLAAAKAAVEQVNGRVPVLSGIGSITKGPALSGAASEMLLSTPESAARSTSGCSFEGSICTRTLAVPWASKPKSWAARRERSMIRP